MPRGPSTPRRPRPRTRTRTLVRHGVARGATLLLAASAAAETNFHELLTLTETNFDKVLREVPVALVVYVSQTTDLHYPDLRPALVSLAAAYGHAGIGVGTVSSAYTELRDRFGVDGFPTLHWMDGSSKWPFYASEAAPVRYSGPRSFDDLARFVTERTGIPPRAPDEQPAEEPPADDDAAAARAHSAAVLAAVEEHDCAALSSVYRACLRHKTPDWHQRLCADERHEYLLCLSGRWAVHPDHHRELARLYHERGFAES